MNRQEAFELLNEFTHKEGLIKHALAVEAVMRAYAGRFNEDPESWGIVGLLHDFDYEKYPTMEDHPYRGREILEERGVPDEWTRAIMGHATYTGVKRTSLMAKTLFAVDELTGLITATALVRPSKKIADVKVKSVKKKLKDKSFAASVNREDIHLGVEELQVELDDHIQFVLQSMQAISDELGL